MAALAEFSTVEGFSLEGLLMPVVLRLSTDFSDADLMAFSSRNSGYRIERNHLGELEIMSPQGGGGARREAFVIRQLGNWAEEYGGAYFSSDAGFRLGRLEVRSPDAAWISDASVASLTESQMRGFPPICPEFLIEILSESDSLPMLKLKMDMWIANGARLAWMIDPFAATVSIYRPGEPVQVLSRPSSVVADSVVPGFRLDTARLWA